MEERNQIRKMEMKMGKRDRERESAEGVIPRSSTFSLSPTPPGGIPRVDGERLGNRSTLNHLGWIGTAESGVPWSILGVGWGENQRGLPVEMEIFHPRRSRYPGNNPQGVNPDGVSNSNPGFISNQIRELSPEITGNPEIPESVENGRNVHHD